MDNIGYVQQLFYNCRVYQTTQGIFGISILVIEKSMPGVFLRQMKRQGLWSTGTAFIIFDNVKVPVENMVGDENEGFKIIMLNFNH